MSFSGIVKFHFHIKFSKPSSKTSIYIFSYLVPRQNSPSKKSLRMTLTAFANSFYLFNSDIAKRLLQILSRISLAKVLIF
jgi:hypothetical protein